MQISSTGAVDTNNENRLCDLFSFNLRMITLLLCHQGIVAQDSVQIQDGIPQTGLPPLGLWSFQSLNQLMQPFPYPGWIGLL